ncbi:purine-binding chemotaxis protein CheW [Paracoccus aurantiacus]|uniref:Purine-binding chemotaxis protein CheW n=1 Tax=Paracoccus aurantiacus TaxID=2599412 RepID=A0A5C6SBX6_9RHOB|nr:chemotaxis protein CheW [Paracoccus aurantiacus]TXB71115.1 purine-binding chemotaxis protein CheW [Paracoccus aurantiacus]
MADNQLHASEDETELLSFRVGTQEYCVEIMLVREIRGWTRATPLPHSPPHVKGVINLRGIVLPVIDLSARLGMDPIEGVDRNVIVVVSVGEITAGLLVDAVSDILTVSEKDMQPAPEIAAGRSGRYIRALIVTDEKLIRVLDLKTILPGENQDAA